MDPATPAPTACGPFPDRAALDALGFGLYCLDDEGRCTYANPACLAMLGYAADEVLGRNMHDLIHHSHPDGSAYPQSACPMVATRMTGRAVRLSNEVLWRCDGSFFTAEYSAWPLRDGDRIAGSVVTLVDTAQLGGASDRLALQVTVSRVLAGMAEPEEVLARLLAAVGGSLGFQAGFFWDVSHRERQLTATASWTAPGFEAGALAGQTMALTLDRGEDLPGRAWEEGEILHTPPRAGKRRRGRRGWFRRWPSRRASGGASSA
ncbi:PAS domain-containing protein [Paracoccus sp. MC1862]|uniref:PAS domain-containing protein n=1 Tax=Paracoccus sp. MC1862 TaxID=2760307 RepID=UPI0015FEC4DE|nr:PAS domain-containing protein [Paracoccus sp. MC1862]MBB1496966.1 PAS domain-containing protein [Paracoccus sp. MC1862]QQO44620.1 PAS domain-containing protein [Paracoccus sp. MC1862]